MLAWCLTSKLLQSKLLLCRQTFATKYKSTIEKYEEKQMFCISHKNARKKKSKLCMDDGINEMKTKRMKERWIAYKQNKIS